MDANVGGTQRPACPSRAAFFADPTGEGICYVQIISVNSFFIIWLPHTSAIPRGCHKSPPPFPSLQHGVFFFRYSWCAEQVCFNSEDPLLGEGWVGGFNFLLKIFFANPFRQPDFGVQGGSLAGPGGGTPAQRSFKESWCLLVNWCIFDVWVRFRIWISFRFFGNLK